MANLGVAVLGVAVLGTAVLGTAVEGVSVLGTAVLHRAKLLVIALCPPSFHSAKTPVMFDNTSAKRTTLVWPWWASPSGPVWEPEWAPEWASEWARASGWTNTQQTIEPSGCALAVCAFACAWRRRRVQHHVRFLNGA